MSEICEASSMARKGRTPIRTDEKSEMLRKLQGRIYFETSLSESSASCHGYSALTLPSCFVQEHGDKFRKAVILRSELSAKSWNVKLTIQYESPAYSRQVKFSAGWKGFATSNGLLAGDSLIFLLTAMSEFTVHIFRGTRSPKRWRSELAQREWSDAYGPSRKRAKQAYGNKDKQWADAEGGSEGTVQLNGVFSKKKIVGEELRTVSASGHCSTSCSLSSFSNDLQYFQSENVQEPTLDPLEPTGSGVTGNVMSERCDVSMARKGRMPFRIDDKSEVLRKLQGCIHFEKSLSTTNSSQLGKSTLALPAWFVKEHGDKFQKSVILRTESSSKPWDVKLTVERRSLECARVIFSGGWKAFANFNKLLAGDLLIFCLTARSEFEVYIFRGSWNPGGWPASQAPTKWSDRSELSWKREEQFHECKDERVTAERSIGGTVKLNRMFAKKAVGEEWMVSGSGPGSKLCTRLRVFPSFLKKLTVSNICYRETACMEIPLDFCKTYGSRLKYHVELQGIHEESQARTMACRATHGNPVRHFLRAEWRDFANENNLEVGQELLFTLTAHSFFVVREVLPSSKELHGP